MRLWRHINILSLDVAVGAMVGYAFFARLFGISLHYQTLIALGLSVWIIYTTDHLLDAYRITRQGKGLASTARHRYHQQHFVTLLVLLIVGALILGIAVSGIPRRVLLSGISLGVLVIGYLLILAWLRFAKEAVGATLYTIGVILVPCATMIRPMSSAEVGLVVIFALTAFSNLLLFAWFDRNTDRLDNQSSFTSALGEKTTRASLIALFLIIGALCSWLIGWHPNHAAPALILLIMNSALLSILCFNNFFARESHYRLAGDAIFLIPLVYLSFFS